jgi:hypothetical protein
MKKTALVVAIVLAVIVLAAPTEPEEAELIWHWVQRNWLGKQKNPLQR